MISVLGNIWKEITFNRQTSQKIKQDYKFNLQLHTTESYQTTTRILVDSVV